MDEQTNDSIRKNRINALMIGFGGVLLIVVGAFLSVKMFPEHAALLVFSLVIVINTLIYLGGKAMKRRRNRNSLR